MINVFVGIKTCPIKKVNTSDPTRHSPSPSACQEVKMSRWRRFVSSLELEKRIDFEVGDLGLAGRIDYPVDISMKIIYG